MTKVPFLLGRFRTLVRNKRQGDCVCGGGGGGGGGGGAQTIK